jgi:hypothetical protein
MLANSTSPKYVMQITFEFTKTKGIVSIYYRYDKENDFSKIKYNLDFYKKLSDELMISLKSLFEIFGYQYEISSSELKIEKNIFQQEYKITNWKNYPWTSFHGLIYPRYGLHNTFLGLFVHFENSQSNENIEGNDELTQKKVLTILNPFKSQIEDSIGALSKMLYAKQSLTPILLEPFWGKHDNVEERNVGFRFNVQFLEDFSYDENDTRVSERFLRSNIDFFQDLYTNFNNRNIEDVINKMTDNVIWANGMDGGYLFGHTRVREYWNKQFTVANSKVTPLKIGIQDAVLEMEQENNLGDKIVRIQVHQVVHDLDNNLLADEIVFHTFLIQDKKIAEFHIGKRIEDNRIAPFISVNLPQ